jgi:esterase/lipase
MKCPENQCSIENMKTKITFQGALGDTLSARLDAPLDEPKAYILFAHCFTCGKDLSTINRVARELNELGLALFRFDFTGLGVSKGDFANTNFSSNVDDLIAAANYMKEHLQAPQILMGHSLGGTAVLAAANRLPEVKAIATIGAPFDATHVTHNFSASVQEIEEKGIATVQLSGRSFTIKKQFLDDLDQHKMHNAIKQLKRALLVMHSPTDDMVGIENAKLIYDAAKHPKSFVSLDTADHLLMKNSEDGIYIARLLAAWASRYVCAKGSR